jgi:NADH-quinone oxidoreductase subunit M
LLLGFVLAFAVKLPLVPFHTWQPEAYASASIETSILLSALMAKTAGFGLLRFAIPMFPDAAERLAPWALAMGVVTVLYASWLAYGQRDLKRVIAYSSAGHLGYVMIGAFALNDLARSGAVLQMFCHGLSVTGLFLVAGHIERRTGTRDLDELGGLWNAAPRLGVVGLVFVLATLGLPGLGNFVGEFLILAGVFQTYPAIGAIAAAGAVFSAAYSLRIVQRVFFGPRDPGIKIADLPVRTLVVCGALIATLLWAGLKPGTLLDAVNPPVAARTLSSGDLR